MKIIVNKDQTMPMKVTVCFDRVRVIVPCGDGHILVGELISKAILRYKKAIGKSSDHWVTVHNLKTSTDGGILDPDDILNDVVDDREQLLADYEEKGGNGYQPHNGDGASASSAGTASPDIFQPPDQSPSFSRKELQDNRHDIVVTPKDLTTGSGLTVRHGSEPMLNVTEEDQSPESKLTVQPIKVKDEVKPTGILHVKQASLDDGKSKNPFSRFARDSWRQSVGSRPDMYKWLEAQERQQDQYRQMERREPVGSVSMETKEDNSVTQPVIKPALTPLTNDPVEIILINDGGPLGIHVVPEYNESQKELGLLVQGIEPGGKIFKDGRLSVNDRIVVINGTSLHGVSFARAQEIFRTAMTTSEIQLFVVKKKPSLPKNPPPVAPKPRSHTPVKPSPLTLPITNKLDLVDQLSPLGPEITSTPTGSVQGTSPDTQEGKSPLSQRTFREPIRAGHHINPLSPIRKVPPVPPARNPKTSLSANPEVSVSTIKAPTNTKRIGKKIAIELTKGPQGLGFSVTTRDNPAGGDSPIYIKNILPKGAAITDGRLKAGDRLLEVNGEDMTGKTQSEAVARLKSCDPGSLVQLVVSRQELEQEERFRVPRKLDNEKENQKQNVLQPAEKSGDDGTLVGMRNKEILTLDIPLKESGSAGLGVSVKGKTQTTEHGQRDLGIFIKAVIHGGAASKDGRLIINDQLLEVNGDVLHGLSNTESMETLRTSMQKDGPLTGYIHLVIARRIGAPSPSPYQEYSTDYMLFDEQRTSGDDSQESKVETESDRTSGAKGSNSKESNNNIKDYIDGAKARNSALERLMSGGNGLRNDSYTCATSEQDVEGVRLRNESYTRATNDSANMFLPGMSPATNHQRSAPTLRSRGTEAVMIEDDPGSKKQNYDMKMRPHSTLGILRGSPPHSNSSSSEDLREQPPSWLRGPDWNRHPSATSDRHQSTTSEEPMSPLVNEPFARDAVGRQSMSEKRRGHQDPRGSEYYQRAKTLRDSQKDEKTKKRRSASFHVSGHGHQRRAPGMVRVGSAESLIGHSSKPNIPLLQLHGNTGPAQKATSSSNLKRCSSLENLTMTGPGDHDDSGEIADSDEDDPSQEEDTPVVPRSMMARGRGTNDSFRAAVDRSYDPVEHSTMETLEEESSGEISGRTNSARSSVSSEATSDDKKGGRRKNKDKKGGNIFKGIFKLGRNKKSAEENTKREVDKQEEEAERHFISRDMGNNRHREMDGNMGQRWTSVPDTHQSYPVSLPQQPSSTSLDSDNHIARGSTPSNMSRAEWIQHLRAEHQRKHKERQGRYPLDDREEGYEREIQETEEQQVHPMYRQYRPNSRLASDGYMYEDQPRSTPSEGYMYEGQGHPRSRPSSRQQYERPPPQPHSYTDYMYQSAPPNIAYQPPAPWPHPSREDPHLQHDYPHVRQNSDSYADREQFPQRPLSRSHTPIEQWRDNHLSYHRKPLYTSAEVHPRDNSYGYNDAVYTYREPVYPPVAGKRQVHTITQPGSAKV